MSGAIVAEIPPTILLLSPVIPPAPRCYLPCYRARHRCYLPCYFAKNRAATVSWKIPPDNSRPFRKQLAFYGDRRLNTPMARKARVSEAMVALMGDGEHHAWTLEVLHAALGRRG